MENLKILNDVDIRKYTPCLNQVLAKNSQPNKCIEALEVYKDGEFYLVKFLSDKESFYNRLSLMKFIFLVAMLSSCSPCKAERAIYACIFNAYA